MSLLFESGGQGTGALASASASASVFSMNSQGWFPLGLTGFISLLSKGLSRVFSSITILQLSAFFTTQLSHLYMTTWKTIALTIGAFVSKVMSQPMKWSEVAQSCPTRPVRLFATPWTVAYQAPLSMGFSRQEYWSGLPFPSPGDLPHPGIEPGSPAS